MSAGTVDDLLGQVSPADADLLVTLLRNAAERSDRAWRSVGAPAARATPMLQLVTEIWASKICTDAALDALQKLLASDGDPRTPSLAAVIEGLQRSQALIEQSPREMAQAPPSAPPDGTAAR
jgi:hypothetical protein